MEVVAADATIAVATICVQATWVGRDKRRGTQDKRSNDHRTEKTCDPHGAFLLLRVADLAELPRFRRRFFGSFVPFVGLRSPPRQVKWGAARREWGPGEVVMATPQS
jgi:hypothetical protein